jgi:hypothetical protein
LIFPSNRFKLLFGGSHSILPEEKFRLKYSFQ